MVSLKKRETFFHLEKRGRSIKRKSELLHICMRKPDLVLLDFEFDVFEDPPKKYKVGL